MISIPEMISPEVLARELDWSTRRVKETALRLNVGHRIGNKLKLTQADVDAIIETTRIKAKTCPSNSMNETAGGGSKAASTDYHPANTTGKAQAYLQRFRKQTHGKPLSSSRPRKSNVILLAKKDH